MAEQSEQESYELFIAPEERRLLARIARRRGVGHDYLALHATQPSVGRARGRPLPRWLGRQPASKPARPTPSRQRTPPQTHRCHTCAHLSPLPAGDGARRYVCGAAVWARPMLEQSLHTSRRLRALSATCPQYRARVQPERQPPHHCRACCHLMAADTVDERYVCGRGVWTNPMKPQSVANARRLARLSSACSYFAPRAGRWLPRSKKRGAAG